MPFEPARLIVLVGVVLLSVLATYRAAPHTPYDLPPEWHHWKVAHGKGYSSKREELYRNVVWQSNKKFIDAHNAMNETFGYTLAMNIFGDMVRIGDN